MKTTLLSLVLLAAAGAPAWAQHHGGHGQHDAGCTPEHAAMGHCVMPEDDDTPPAHEHDTRHDHGHDADCTPEHAAMGHCVMPEDDDTPPAHDHDAHHGHGHDAGCTPEHAAMGHCVMPVEEDPDCPPEHAAMGHCTPRPAQPPGLLEPREPIPELTEADRAAAFPVLHGGHGHGSAIHWRARFNRLEAWDADPGTGQAWSGNLWVGGDINRLLVKTSGERSGGRTDSANVEALYSRAVRAWWDVVAGVKHDFQPDSRTWGAVGVQGLAPYMFEVSAMAYVTDGGQAQVKFEAEYDMLLTNRLILQPLVEVTASLKNEPEHGIGSGLGKLEAGLRLRYEITRRFAPYIGLVHERALGNTADIARDHGGHLRDTRVVAGVRFWF